MLQPKNESFRLKTERQRSYNIGTCRHVQGAAKVKWGGKTRKFGGKDRKQERKKYWKREERLWLEGLRVARKEIGK